MINVQQMKAGKEALRVDGVLCDGQLERLGIRPELFPGRYASVCTNVNDPISQRFVTFRALEERSLRYADPAQLAHMAGTAEIRLLVGAPLSQWRTSPLGGNLREPDARWSREEGAALIEYDACGYKKRVVWQKMEAFVLQGQVIWGTSSSLRADRISRRYKAAKVLYVPWWEGPEERAHTLAGGNGRYRAARRVAALAYR